MRNPVRNISSSFVLASFVFVAAASGGALSTTGCGGGGGSGGSGGGGPTCFDYATFDGTTPAVSFKTDVLPILQRSCGVSTACHGDSSAPKQEQPYFGPNKNTTATADDITAILAGTVGVSSFYEPAMNLIKAGDPENSFVMHKLDDDLDLACANLDCTGTKACGGIMPQGATEPLASDERDKIRRWIAQGAANN